MISVLIPTYGYDCTSLVSTLRDQAVHAAIPYEIIVADDGSLSPLSKGNERINSWTHCRYIANTTNLGRARIRNFLADQALGDWLLFMDCDAAVPSPDFLSRYAQSTTLGSEVVVGGMSAPPTLPSPRVSLRYKYEKRLCALRTPVWRSAHPYKQFSTFCFLIKAATFQSVRFYEGFILYGHEDTHFGYALQQRHIPIAHIDNPLCHLGLEPNADYIKKTEVGISTLWRQQQQIAASSRLLETYQRLLKWRLAAPYLLCFRLMRPLWYANLCGRHPSLHCFQLYKLGFLCLIAKNNPI